MSKQWFVAKDGAQKGPFTEEDLIKDANAGQIRPFDLVWSEGMSNWFRFADVFSAKPARSAPPPAASPPGGAPSGFSSQPSFQQAPGHGAQQGFQQTQGYGYQPQGSPGYGPGGYAPGGQGLGHHGPGHFGQPHKKVSGALIGIVAFLILALGIGGFFGIKAFLNSGKDPVSNPGNGNLQGFTDSGTTPRPPLEDIYADPKLATKYYYEASRKFNLQEARQYASRELREYLDTLEEEIKDMANDPESSFVFPLITDILTNFEIDDMQEDIYDDYADILITFKGPDWNYVLNEIEKMLTEMEASGAIDPNNMREDESAGLIRQMLSQILPRAPQATFKIKAYTVREDGEWLMDNDLIDDLLWELDIYTF